MEKKEEVKVFEVKFFCDQCDTEVKFSGRTQLTHPPRYIHSCPNCSKEFSLHKCYPAIEYKEAGK